MMIKTYYSILLNCPIFSFRLFLFILVTLILSDIIIGPHGPIIVTIIGYLVFAFILSSIRFKDSQSKKYQKLPNIWKVMSIIGPLAIYHSHHSPAERKKGREFSLAGRFFCSSCYGLTMGIILGATWLVLFLLLKLSIDHIYLLLITFPLWFILIILRYTVWKNMKAFSQFFANLFLPIGCAIGVSIIDFLLNSGVVNGLLVFILGGIACLRIHSSAK
ncbi:MAG: hypothetical protein ACFFAU_19880 [Candidatus Hodarchaeota archaeon]